MVDVGAVYQGVNINVNCPVAQRWNVMDCGVISVGIVQLVRRQEYFMNPVRMAKKLAGRV